MNDTEYEEKERLNTVLGHTLTSVIYFQVVLYISHRS